MLILISISILIRRTPRGSHGCRRWFQVRYQVSSAYIGTGTGRLSYTRGKQVEMPPRHLLERRQRPWRAQGYEHAASMCTAERQTLSSLHGSKAAAEMRCGWRGFSPRIKWLLREKQLCDAREVEKSHSTKARLFRIKFFTSLPSFSRTAWESTPWCWSRGYTSSLQRGRLKIRSRDGGVGRAWLLRTR